MVCSNNLIRIQLCLHIRFLNQFERKNIDGSTFCLLVPSGRGPFKAGFSHSCGVGKDERKQGGMERKDPQYPAPSLFLRGHHSENISWCACTGWAQPSPADMGAEKQLVKYLQSSFCLDPLPPLSLPKTHMHTQRSPQKSTSFCLSIQAHPSLSGMCYSTEKLLEDVGTSSGTLSWKAKSSFIPLMEEQIRNYRRTQTNLPENEIWNFLAQFSLLLLRKIPISSGTIGVQPLSKTENTE